MGVCAPTVKALELVLTLAWMKGVRTKAVHPSVPASPAPVPQLALGQRLRCSPRWSPCEGLTAAGASGLGRWKTGPRVTAYAQAPLSLGFPKWEAEREPPQPQEQGGEEVPARAGSCGAWGSEPSLQIQTPRETGLDSARSQRRFHLRFSKIEICLHLVLGLKLSA